jgi:hypothetical protein
VIVVSDAADGWTIRCEAHGEQIAVTKKTDVKLKAPAPTGWCGGCAKMAKK